MRNRLSRLTIILCALAVWGIGTDVPAGSETGSGGLRIVAPAPDEVLFTNRQAEIVLAVDGLVSPFAVITVTATPLPYGEEMPIAETAYSDEDGDGLSEQPWILRDVKPGAYRVAVTLADEGSTAEASVPVRVLAPPRATIALKYLAGEGRSLAGTLRASAKPSAGARITRYVWSIGADTPVETTTPNLHFVIQPKGPKLPVALDVFDTAGGVSRVVRLINVPARIVRGPVLFPELFMAPPPPDDFCGCSAMTVNAIGRTGAYCLSNKPELLKRAAAYGCTPVAAPPAGTPAPPNPCPADKVAIDCGLGRLDPGADPAEAKPFGVGFEVIATLVEGSTPLLCTEGQAARGKTVRDAPALPKLPVKFEPDKDITLPVDGGAARKIKIRFNPIGTPADKAKEYPEVNKDDEWGADDYTLEKTEKRYSSPNEIRWFDIAQVAVRPQTTKIDDQFQFLSFVLGADGQPSCWCQLDLKQSWERKKGAGGPGLTRSNGLKCTFVDR
jgi:hypothetical protein